MGSVCAGGNAKVAPTTRELPQLDLAHSVAGKKPRYVVASAGGPKQKLEAAASSGLCIVYLEKAQNVPLDDAIRDLTCQCAGSKQHGYPFVRIWAEGPDKKVVGQVAQWHYKQSHEEPRWFSARSLNFVIAENPDVTLVAEIWDQSSKARLGSCRLPLSSAKLNAPVEFPMETRKQYGGPCKLFLQVLNSSDILQKKTVYFVRHGESIWNKAQSQMDLVEMGKTTDHALSLKGRQQAQKLREQVKDAMATKDANLEGFFKPDVVFVSPLTRAIQTAVIGMEDVLTDKSNIVITSNVREKQNFGGRDSIGKVYGPDIVQRAYDELIKSYDGHVNSTIEKFSRLCFDIQEVEERWWIATAESSVVLQARMEEFMSQLIYSPHQNVVVVGHSHWIRALFKQYMSEGFKEKKPKLAKEVGKEKLCNCGVAKVEVDASVSSQTPIVDIELVLGTTWAVDSGFQGCCAATGGDKHEMAVSPEAAKPYAKEEPELVT
eukprot:gnl/MRDRNA2_/MRDRNA2_119381_c0_seq1.p1 gnl/MRDRNA2_/MRDRNA2_119381_c0~~gnl/MRDRNA2_/MRDRNA2_119381_c0_seq1.p1  ORF type:complete len:490 (+),score=111.15 gnl/MRDRNA2_/MRDRNA2_119381_c0_seq1:86-1555(+)